MFAAGANSMLVGNYLTTTGDPVEKDMQLIRNAGRIPMQVRH
jgi:biotin synthase-like enzyme